jgi:hypothetical protein
MLSSVLYIVVAFSVAVQAGSSLLAAIPVHLAQHAMQQSQHATQLPATQ